MFKPDQSAWIDTFSDAFIKLQCRTHCMTLGYYTLARLLYYVLVIQNLKRNARFFFTLFFSVLFVFIPPLRRRGWSTVLALPVLPSVLSSVSNIFRCTFLSNHASQPLQTWYGALARGPTRRLPNSILPGIYFPFYDLAYFLT